MKSSQRMNQRHFNEMSKRKVSLSAKTARAGRMSISGSSFGDAMSMLNSLYTRNVPSKKGPSKIISLPPQANYRPPVPAYQAKDYPGCYVASSLNYVAKLGGEAGMTYCIDKRTHNSIKLKLEVLTNPDSTLHSAIISIYE